MKLHATPTAAPTFTTFEDFWPYYLMQHQNVVCRWLHFVGTTLALALLIGSVALGHPLAALGAPPLGYAFAWTGHFAFEGNRPATWGWPSWSLRAEFRMYFWMLRGKSFRSG